MPDQTTINDNQENDDDEDEVLWDTQTWEEPAREKPIDDNLKPTRKQNLAPSKEAMEWWAKARRPIDQAQPNEFPFTFLIHGCQIRKGCICAGSFSPHTERPMSPTRASKQAQLVQPRSGELITGSFNKNKHETEDLDEDELRKRYHKADKEWKKQRKLDKKAYEDKLALEKQWKKLVQAIWCICLKERTDRQRESEDRFHAYGMCRLVRYFRCDRPPEKHCVEQHIISRGRYGCWSSHQLVAQLSVSYERTLVLEDDSQWFPERVTPTTLKGLRHNLLHHVPSSWDMFKLGQLTLSGEAIETCNKASKGMQIYKTKSYAAHALIYSQRGAVKMSRTTFQFVRETNKTAEFDVDCWMAKTMETYTCYPQLACQSGSETDNVGNYKSAFIERCRQNVVPMLLNQHRKYCNAIDIFMYCVLPYLTMLVIGITLGFTAMILISKGTSLWHLWKDSADFSMNIAYDPPPLC